MDWANEEYVRLYTRETADDLELSWEAVALWRAMLCKFDRSGVIQVRNGWPSLARMVRMPIEVVERVGPELVTDGRVRVTKHGFVAPNFTEAQTASKSDKLRQRESRDRRREIAMAKQSENTRAGHGRSRAVTKRDPRSQDVTLPLPPVAEAPVALPPVALSPAAPERARDAGSLDGRDRKKREIVAKIGPEHAMAFARVKSAIGSTAMGLSVVDGFTELRDLLESMPSLADAEAMCRHALAVREAEAMSKRSVQYFGSSMWKRSSFDKALALEIADVDGSRPASRGGGDGLEYLAQIANGERP